MASNPGIRNIFSKFQAANQRLEEILSKETDEIEMKRDSVIKRFEFTYELLWKTYKRIAKQEKIECFSPKSAFQVAFQLGLIDNEQLYLEIIDARNQTTHVYSEEDIQRIYNFITEKVTGEFRKSQTRLMHYIEKT